MLGCIRSAMRLARAVVMLRILPPIKTVESA